MKGILKLNETPHLMDKSAVQAVIYLNEVVTADRKMEDLPAILAVDNALGISSGDFGSGCPPKLNPGSRTNLTQ